MSVSFANKLKSELTKDDLIKKIEKVVQQFVEVIEFTLTKCKDTEQ